MGAKDTVIKDIPQGTEPQTTLCRHCAYLATQAEISFKAGMEEEAKGGHNPIAYLEGYQEGMKQGVKKVVADFETVLDASAHYRLEMFYDVLNTWQAQFKDWGIKEEK